MAIDQIDHLDPFALAHRNGETANASNPNRAGQPSSGGIRIASLVGEVPAEHPPEERAMPDTHNVISPGLAFDFEAAETALVKFRVAPGDDDGTELYRLVDRINLARPRCLTDLAVKLRVLADDDIGIASGARETDEISLKQVLVLVEELTRGARIAPRRFTGDPTDAVPSTTTGQTNVLLLFDRWLQQIEAYDRECSLVYGETSVISDRIEEIEEEIARTVGGPAALAIKAFLLVRYAKWEERLPVPRGAGDAVLRYPQDDDLDMLDRLRLSVLRDAANIAPVLMPLVAPLVHDDAALIDADFEIQVQREWLAEFGDADRVGRKKEVEASLKAALECVAMTEAKTETGQVIKARYADGDGAADSALAAAFQRWMQVVKAANVPRDEDVPDELLQAESGLIDEVAEMPVSGPVGFALKAYLATYYGAGVGFLGKVRGDACGLRAIERDQYGAGDKLYLGARLARGLLIDAARFAPELTPLAVDVINSPVTLD